MERPDVRRTNDLDGRDRGATWSCDEGSRGRSRFESHGEGHLERFADVAANSWLGVIPVLVLIVVIGWLFSQCFGGDGAGDGVDAEFSGKVVSIAPVDEANLAVIFEVTNDGTSSAKGSCTLKAKDASGRIVGFDFFTTRKALSPGESVRGRGVLRIEDEGAFRVQKVVGSDCEEA